MTLLTAYAETAPHALHWQADDVREITARLARVGVRFERWPLHAALPTAADGEQVLAHYAPQIERLQRERGWRSADVVRLQPDHPDRVALRHKFIDEHTHADDEVRFFVEGGGAFYLRLGGEVLQLVCTAGDLVSVPAGTRHWFDMGPQPLFTAIRLFDSPDGWVAQFTGDPISAALPRFEPTAAAAR